MESLGADAGFNSKMARITLIWSNTTTTNNNNNTTNIDNNIIIMLNESEVITLKVKKCFCLLEDIGKPIYPAIIPAYSKND